MTNRKNTDHLIQYFLDLFCLRRAPKVGIVDDEDPKDLIIATGTIRDAPSGYRSLDFAYINNPDGRPRWVFPLKNSYPIFLSLYNSAGWKGKIYPFVMRLAYRLGMQQRLFSGVFTLHYRKSIPLLDLILGVPHDAWALFTGTVGENQKLVLAVAQEHQVSHFVKIAHTLQAEQLIGREAEMLEELAETHWVHIRAPEVLFHQDRAACISNVGLGPVRQCSRLEVVHAKALSELHEKRGQTAPLKDLPFWTHLQDRLEQLEQAQLTGSDLDQEIVFRLRENVFLLSQRLAPDKIIACSLFHGDFTPWNMYKGPEALHLYDWELAQADYPIFFDLFHFIYQSEILLRRTSYEEILRQIQQAFEIPEMKQLLYGSAADWDFYHQLYLLYTASYYLLIYSKEKKVHTQAHWLVKTWDLAIRDFI